MWQNHLARILGSNGDDQRSTIGGWHVAGMRDANPVDFSVHLPDVDVLMDLARTDPERLETLRRSLVNDVIDRAEDPDRRRRLEGLQAQIDMIERGSPNALVACVRVSAMMSTALATLRDTLTGNSVTHEEDIPTTAADESRIIPFPRRDG